MRILLFLLCALPVLCIGQSPSNVTAATQHQQAVQQLQQQVPKAEVVDLEHLSAQQASEHSNCSSCAKKAALTRQSPSQQAVLASKPDLLAEQTRLIHTIQQLRQATPVDAGLLQKYLRALEINVAELKLVETAQKRQNQDAIKKQQLAR